MEFIQHLPTYFNLTSPALSNERAGHGASDNLKNVYIDNEVARFQIVNYSEIKNKIIPFFEKYSILGKKSLDFISFKEVALIINNKDHLKLEGFEQILDIKGKMNK